MLAHVSKEEMTCFRRRVPATPSLQAAPRQSVWRSQRTRTSRHQKGSVPMARPVFLAAMGLCSAVSAVHIPSPTGTYAPFVSRTYEMLAEAGVTMRPYEIPDELAVVEGAGGAHLTVRSFCTDKLRQGRLLLLDGGPSLQVLNLCFFPRLDLPLPTFSADLVTLRGGSLIAIDCQPNGRSPPPNKEADAALDAAFAHHRPRLPSGGPIPPESARFFSRRFLWSRLPAQITPTQIQELVLPAFEEYLQAYLRLMTDSTPLSDDADVEAVRAAQLEYTRYRTEEDPARPMLSRIFGNDLAERLLREVLFDLPLVLESSQSDTLYSRNLGTP